MSRIAAIDPSTAPATVKPLLDGVQKGMGVTPNLFRVAGQSPAALESLVAQFGAAGKGSFDARTREAIALTVSESNACDYCLSAHCLLGKRAGLNDDALANARVGKSDDPHLGALLKLARTIVDRRGRVGDALDEARRSGISDAEVVELVANVALTTFTNYLNEVAGTDIDFPVVRHNAR
jgi:AhpD family alkylhydroperoxidase